MLLVSDIYSIRIVYYKGRSIQNEKETIGQFLQIIFCYREVSEIIRNFKGVCNFYFSEDQIFYESRKKKQKQQEDAAEIQRRQQYKQYKYVDNDMHQ